MAELSVLDAEQRVYNWAVNGSRAVHLPEENKRHVTGRPVAIPSV